jgi:glutaredoxin 3
MKSVVLYGREDCEFSAAAKELLREHGISFSEIDVGAEPGKLAEMIRRANGQRTTPQIFIDGRSIGGHDELRRLADQGGLDAGKDAPAP